MNSSRKNDSMIFLVLLGSLASVAAMMFTVPGYVNAGSNNGTVNPYSTLIPTPNLQF